MQEEWRFIKELDYLYSASSLGRIRSEPRKGNPVPKIKSQSLSSNKKYMRVTVTPLGLKSIQLTVHRLVAWAFLGYQKEGVEVRHINGDSFDNRVENLCYGTKSDNMRDAIAHRTFSMSEWHPCAKLTKEQVADIRSSNEYYKDVALKYGIHPFTVHKIRRNKVRNHEQP